jgi:monofunctional biosynthetic peptidoglycan transglycosylase
MVKRAFAAMIGTGFWFAVVCALWVLTLRVLPPPVTWVMAEQSNEQGAVQREWVALERMSHDMPLAVIASEDQRFLHHHGFSWKAIRRAMEYNEKKKGKKVKGASTISQQTAKNVFCWPGRTFIRKGFEAWFTVLIEALWSKERIVEVYLNVAETGKGRFGVQATARACFKHDAARLSNGECALIAAVLPKPRSFNACAPSGYIRRRQGDIQRQMRLLGDVFDPAVMERTRERIRKEEEAEDRREAM